MLQGRKTSDRRIWTTKNEYLDVDPETHRVKALGFLFKSVDGEWVVYAYDEHMRHIFLDKVKNKNTAKATLRKYYIDP